MSFESVKNRILKFLRPSRTREKAVLFADIVSSTELYESQGNATAKELVDDRLRQLSGMVHAHHGRVIKHLGDGILCDFSSPGDAFGSGLAMSREDPHGLGIRVGIHVGEIVEEGGDIFGDAVNTAARIASIAKPWEILISKDLLKRLPAAYNRLVQPLKPVSVKGKAQPLQLFSVLRMNGSQASSTMCATALIVDDESLRDRTLELEWLETKTDVDGKRTSLTIGRQSDNDLVVDREYVSRTHATVSWRDGKHILADQSSNGTYLVPNGGVKVHLRREETMLNGSGLIFLGVDPDKEGAEGVAYRVR